MKKIYTFFSSIELTFWLLLTATFLFLTGSLYSYRFYQYFEKLDVIPFQQWVVNNVSDPHKIWWVILLYIILFLLSINTVICTYNRLKFLVNKRKNLNGTFFKLVLPSAIHLTFIIILVGHFITFTIAEHRRIPIKEGSTIKITETDIRIKKIDFQLYSEKSTMKGHVKQCTVKLAEKNNEYKLSYMNPLFIKGRFLHVEIEKKNKSKNEKNETTVCNRSEVKNDKDIEPQVFIFESYDPGFFFIVIGLGIIIILMTIYYIPTNKKS